MIKIIWMIGSRHSLHPGVFMRSAEHVSNLGRLGLAACIAFVLSACGGGGGGSDGNSAAATGASTAGNVAGGDASGPTAPTGLTASVASGTSIQLRWNASSDNVGVAGYHVFRSGSNTALATISGTAHTDSGLAGNTTFSYQVAAFDAAGNTSARSVTSAATTPASGPPPAGLISSVKSGAWTDPAVWSSGSVPSAGADVRVSATHELTYDAQTSPGVHTLLINGVLRFARDRNTVLDVGLIVVSAQGDFDVARSACADHGNHNLGAGPALEVGTRDAPIPAGVTAKIRLLAYADLDVTCAPAIVSHGGRMEFHGAAMPVTWAKLTATAAAGTRSLSLAQAVNWKAGDTVIVTATDKRNRNGGEGLDPNGSIANGFALPRTEQHTIAQVAADGRSVTIAAPLAIAHRGGANVDDLRGEVANLSRNVIVESAAPLGVRGHVMYHTSGAGGVSYAEFRHLG